MFLWVLTSDRCLVLSIGEGKGGISGGIELGKTGTVGVNLGLFYYFSKCLDLGYFG